MQTRGHRDDPCYGRRAVLGLALATLAVGRARRPRGRRRQAAAAAGRSLCVPDRPEERDKWCRLDNLAGWRPAGAGLSRGPDGTVRSETPLNLVILARFDPAELSDETRARAAEGVVAYSAICTHQACPVNMWSKDAQWVRLLLPRFDLRSQERRRGLFGPAPRPLPSLGLKVADGVVTVASGFSSRVGGTVK